jgi:lipoate-protein ligase A
MAHAFRVIDTGLRSGRENIAFDQALIEARQSDAIPDSIRFLRFPPTALVGRHQDLSREIRLEHCRETGIGIARRITGGGAIYFDEGQLGWELVFKRGTFGFDGLEAVAAAICGAAAAGLSGLGIDARFRPRNDIEVDGRKLCGTGGFFDGDVLFFQGTLLIDMNPADMVAALKVPRAKLEKRKLDDAGQRVTTLRQFFGESLPGLDEIQAAMLAGFGESLDIEMTPGSPGETEERLARELHDEEIGTEAFVRAIDGTAASEGLLTASHSGPGGTVSVFVRLEGPASDRIREVLITGDFFVTPPRTVFDLEASLRGIQAADVGAAVERFFERTPIDALTLTATDLRDVLVAAVGAR